MAEFIRSVVAQNESVSAGEVITYDLPTNPMSHVYLTLRALNVTDEATLAELLARLQRVEILFRGGAIISMSGADLFAMNAVIFGNMPILGNQIATDNAARYLSLIIPFGRKIFNLQECFPGSNKGELQIQVTMSATETAADNAALQIESVELPSANPTKYLKSTTLSVTPSATGDLDIDLPIANELAGLLLYSTTIPATTAFTTTVSQVKLLANSKELNFAKANWESLHGELLNRVGHREAYDGSADNDDIANYAFMDFTPMGMDDFLINTRDFSSFKLRVNAGDTNAIRVLPVELVTI